MKKLFDFSSLAGRRETQCNLNFPNAHLAPFGQIMFPYAHYAPPFFSQEAIYLQISGLICKQFFLPKGTIVDRHIAMLWTAVPEAAINKDCQLDFWKRKVRFSENLVMASPACDLFLPEKVGQNDFCFLISAPTNPGHDI